MGALTLTAVTKSFGSTDVIKGVDLEVARRRVLRLRRPLRLRQVHAPAHHRRPRGRHLRRHPDRRQAGQPRRRRAEREIAMVFQTYALYPHLTVRDNMALGLKQAGAAAAVDRRARRRPPRGCCRSSRCSPAARPSSPAASASASPSAAPSCARRSSSSSTSRSPTSTPRSASHTRIEIARLHRELAATMIYVTHDQVEAMTLADRIVVLNAGRVEQVGAPMELYNDPANTFVAGFIGSPQMNFLEAAPLGAPGKTLGIRPEHLEISREAGAHPRHDLPRRAPRRRDQRLRPHRRARPRSPSAASASTATPSTRPSTSPPTRRAQFHFDAEGRRLTP